MSEDGIPNPQEPDPDESLLFACVIRGARYAFDPYRVGRLLSAALQGESVWDVMGRALDENSPLAPQSMDKLLGAVCRAFNVSGLQPDGTGLTEAELLRVLREFVDWQEGVRRFFGPRRTWLSPGESGSPSPDAPPHPLSATAAG